MPQNSQPRVLTLALFFLVAGLLAIVVQSLEPVPAARAATTWTVQSTADGAETPANCPGVNCRLRDAIAAALSGDTIDFQLPFPATITLISGTLSVTNLTINGSTTSTLTINGNNASGVFSTGGNVTIRDVTIQGGNASGNQGGGIYNGGTLTLTNTIIFSNTALSGGGIYNNGGILVFTNVTVTNNYAGGSGGGIYHNNNGGPTRLTLLNSTITGNMTAGDGGGIISGGTITMTNSTISANQSGNNGGAIWNGGLFTVTIASSNLYSNTASANGGAYYGGSTGSKLTVDSSTIRANIAYSPSCSVGCSGGGIYTFGPTTITNTGVISNTAGNSGGGIYKAGSTAMTLTGVTISANTAKNSNGGGGGIDASSSITMTLTNVTISGNSADPSGSGWGGGILSTDTPANLNNVTITKNSTGSSGGGGIRTTGLAQFNIKNTIIAGNTAPSGPDCYTGASLNSEDYNLIQNISVSCTITGTTTHNITGQDPKLTPLAWLGGPTQTHGLLAGSPALDQIPGGTNGCGTTYTTDQRGFARPQNGSCDIGAFEGTEYPLYLPLIEK